MYIHIFIYIKTIDIWETKIKQPLWFRLQVFEQWLFKTCHKKQVSKMAMSVPLEHRFFMLGSGPPALGFETAFIYYHNFRPPAKLTLKQDEMGQRKVCFESQNHTGDVWLSSGWHGKWSSYIREGGIIHLHVTFNCYGHNNYEHSLHLTSAPGHTTTDRGVSEGMDGVQHKWWLQLLHLGLWQPVRPQRLVHNIHNLCRWSGSI